MTDLLIVFGLSVGSYVFGEALYFYYFGTSLTFDIVKGIRSRR